MVGGQHQVDRRAGPRTRGQLHGSKLIEVAGQQEVPAALIDVEHQAAGVVGGLRVPASRWMQHRESRRAVLPACRRGDGPHRNAAGTHLLEQQCGTRVGIAHEARRDHDLTDLEPIQQVGKRVVMILIGMAEVDLVQLRDAPAPERRGDDPTPDLRIAHATAIVQERMVVFQAKNDRQTMTYGKQVAFDRGPGGPVASE